MRRAVVVAHPDDESLFFGGLVIAEPGDDWTVICCSIPRLDPIRAWKFFDACAVLGASGLLLPFVESEPHKPLGHLDALDLSRFDEVVTHNEHGEYGHAHHVELHRFVAQRCPGRTLVNGYGRTTQGRLRYALDAGSYERKLAAIHCYNHISPSDGQPKGSALLARYGSMFNLSVETYDRAAV